MWEWAKMQPKRERFVWPFYEVDKISIRTGTTNDRD